MRAWPRFVMVAALVVVGASPLGGVSAQSPAAGYRCAGTGTLTGRYVSYGSPGLPWSGWEWSLAGETVCVLSPNGPWQGTISGRAYGCGIGAPVGLTESAWSLPEWLGVTLTLANPRTGQTRELRQVWDLQIVRVPEPTSFIAAASVDAPAYRLVVHRPVGSGPCKDDDLGPGDGVGALLHVPSRAYRWRGDRVTDPFSFASNSPGGA